MFWQTLRKYGAQPDPLYTAISSGVWLVSGLTLTSGLWRGKTWAWPTALGCAAGYPAWFWFNRLILQEPNANWPFALGVTLVWLFLVLVLLFTRKTILFFQIQRKSDERQ
jgi:hypothetical protein